MEKTMWEDDDFEKRIWTGFTDYLLGITAVLIILIIFLLFALKEKGDFEDKKLVADVLFRPNRSNIKEAGMHEIKILFDKSIVNKEYERIIVSGHTDPRTPNRRNKDNWELGSKRANAVVRYLIDSLNVDPKKIMSASFSSYQPEGKKEDFATNEEYWSQMRTIKFTIIKKVIY